MSINWDEFYEDWEKDGAEIDEDLSIKWGEKLASASSLKEEVISEICPTPADKKALGDLIRIVQGAEDENTKISQIVDGGEKIAGILVKLLGKLF